MSKPFERLLALVELNLSQMGQRAIEQASIRVKAKSHELLAEMVEAITAAARTVAIKAGLALLAAAMLVMALVFAFSAMFHALEGGIGPIEAMLVMAAMFAVLAILAGVTLLLWPSAATASRAVRPSVEASHARAAMAAAARLTEGLAAADKAEAASEHDAATRSNTPESHLSPGLAAMVAALGEAGFQREQAGLRAGLAIANQLRPMQLVSLALLGGFVAGWRMTGRRRG